jgi:predicted glycosyltransferase involved in capsule biosynthesis
MKLLTLWLGILLFTSGCSAPPTRIAETESGQPEVVIRTTDKSAIKQNLIARNTATGWALEQESENTMLFTRVDASGSANTATTLVLLGGSANMPPRYEARYMFAQTAAGFKVVVNAFVAVQTTNGLINRQMISDTNATFNAFQTQLFRVKGETA